MPTKTSSVRSRSATVRVERPDDRDVVDALVAEAFDDASVARLVQLVRASDHFVPELSLVAERGGELVGHVMLSSADIATEMGTSQVLLLAPLAVRPSAQGTGVARLLVEAALSAAEQSSYGVVLLEGDPRLYSRFGFRAATAMGLERPSELIPDAGWQAYPLPRYETSVRGRVEYPSAFWETGSVGPPS